LILYKKRLKDIKGTFNNYSTSRQSTSSNLSDLPTPSQTIITQNSFNIKNKKYNISIPSTSMENIQLGVNTPMAFKSSASFSSLHNSTLSISLSNKNTNIFTGKALRASNNTIVFSEYQEDTDVAIQAFEDSIKIYTVLNSPISPTEYNYNINLPVGAKMKKTKDGGVLILDKNKKLIGFFTPAWAIDKNRKKIPTHYEINGNILTQVVNHLSIDDIAYPVVADPYWGYTMVDAGQWVSDSPHSSNSWFNYILFIYPSNASKWFHSKTAARAGWTEIRNFMPYTTGSNNNEVSLQNQYMCHVQYAWARPGAYHLEQWRRPVSYLSTVTSACNPLGVI